eukprot:1230644-Rhodomonas_salina.2
MSVPDIAYSARSKCPLFQYWTSCTEPVEKTLGQYRTSLIQPVANFLYVSTGHRVSSPLSVPDIAY